MKKLLLISILATTLFTTFAAATGFGSGVANFIYDITRNVVGAIGYFFLTSAVVVFFYGMVRFLIDRRDGKDPSDDKAMMTWGILALFIMFSIWGIITFAQKLLSDPTNPNGANLGQTTIQVPQFQFAPSGNSGGTTDPSPFGGLINTRSQTVGQ